ncbi:mechanosensitive ion channel family protein [Bacillus gobiensis]|uniref:mechanosensitive ion channel family protein n=1 Tax=Bacillus gobiensis TaxID=1441095 RepID=UPI003D19BD83
MFDNILTWDNTVQVGISLLILLVFLLLRKLFTKYLFSFIVKLTGKSKRTIFVNHVVLAFEKPVRWFFVILGIYLTVQYAPFIDGQTTLISRLFRSSIIVLLTWGLFNLVSTSSFIFSKFNRRSDSEMEDILTPFLSRITRFILVALSLSIIAQEFDYDVNGFVAGLGIGGLAFALAAQDSIANFFGGVIIITEKPFNIGDYISTPSVEGSVEDISFRSTRIRTGAMSLVTVPNKTLANEPITNISKMGKRQITFSLLIDFETPKENMTSAIKRIKEMLDAHDGIHDELIMVHFNQFQDGNLNLFFNFYTKTTAWVEHLNIRQDVNYKIIEILAEEQVELAYPSQTLFIKQEEGEPFEIQGRQKEYS